MSTPTPQPGALCCSVTLDCNAIWVEYDYEPGEPARVSGSPENCYEGSDEVISLLNVLVNEAWVAADLFSQYQQDRWIAEIEEHHTQQRESDMEDRAEREREYA